MGECNWVSGIETIIWTLVGACFVVVIGFQFLRDM